MKESKMLYQKLYDAYWSARKNKRSKPEQMNFEYRYEEHLCSLYHEIISRTYQPLPTRVFVTRKPVDREIFAPQFRDRVVHHLIYRYIYKALDRQFIYDSYSCREGRGTLFGIERAKAFLRKVSQNYTRDAWVLKLDITGYFMHINREILRQKIHSMLDYSTINATQTEQEALRYLIDVVSTHDATRGAIRCSPYHYWKTIPKSKSLFHTEQNCGLPIGSLTSQLFSNVYMNEVDHLIKKDYRYYGRYVDDLLLMDTDKQKLQDAIPLINGYLKSLGLKLHPKKIYLQHYTKGFYFLGQYLKPGRCYINKRIKKHFYNYLTTLHHRMQEDKAPSLKELALIESISNSYFSVFSKANTYHYTEKIIHALPERLYEYACFSRISRTSQMKMQLYPHYKIKNNYAETYGNADL